MAKVSIIIPVYNSEEFLSKAIDSILKQTFKDLNIVLVVEAGTNSATLTIVNQYKETYSNIIVIKNKETLGLPKSLNEGIRRTDSQYIARMDADDIAYPQRLMQQVRYLDVHPEIGIVGCMCRVNGSYIRRTVQPEDYESIKFKSYFDPPFDHPTVMWRNKLFKENNLYYDDLTISEDFEFWGRVLRITRGHNLKGYYQYYRITGHSKTNQSQKIDKKMC